MLDHADIHEALDAHRRAVAAYLFDPEVRLVDVGWRVREGARRVERGALCVRVHRSVKPRGAAFEMFKAIHPDRVVDAAKIGFPVDVVHAPYRLDGLAATVERPPVAPLPEALPRRLRYRPLRGGASGIRQLGSAATLGGFVRDRQTGVPMILSNFHVLAGSVYAQPGQPIVQPSPYDDPGGNRVVARYAREAMMQSLDAAVASLVPGIEFENYQIGLGPVTGLDEPRLDEPVTKSGRTTGVTSGMIDGFAGQGRLANYGGYPVVIRDVWHIGAGGKTTSERGDSGSWWLNERTRRVVGLHFAGYHGWDADYALMMTMSSVLEALRVDLALE